MLGHEVDDLRRYFFGRNRQVPFVLPVFVIYND